MKSCISLAALFLFLGVSTFGQTPLSDPEVASVAVAANTIDIKYAELAKKKSSNAEVLNFAETMIKDHNAVIEQASALVKKLGVTPKDNAVTRKLTGEAEKTRATLNNKSGAEFDRAYIENEVTYHKAVIDAVKNLLIPETDNKELKDLLTAILPALDTHLQHAEMVQKNVSK